MKKLILTSMVAVSIFFAVGLCFASSCGGGDHSAKASEAQAPVAPAAIEVGNTVCPVSGTAIDAAKKATFEYEGKVYNFCCEGCIEKFKADPAGYISKMQGQPIAEPQAKESEVKS